jgi:hypothetical protein
MLWRTANAHPAGLVPAFMIAGWHTGGAAQMASSSWSVRCAIAKAEFAAGTPA